MSRKIAEAADAVAGRLQGLVDGMASRKGIRHVVAAVESADGSFRFTGAAGGASPSGAPMRADTPFFIASIDKLLNATIVFKLIERGQLGLDDPVMAHLPESLVGGLHRLNGTDHTPKITLRHLLGHSSGLPDWLEDSPRRDRSLVDQVVETGDRAIGIEEVLHYVRDRLTPHFPPQSMDQRRPKVRYTDTGFMLLCAVIEAVTGRPLQQAHEEMLWRPLDLRHTWIAGHSRPLEATIEPATVWAGDRALEIPLLMRSFWGVYSTAHDLLRFLRALTGGEIFERAETYGSMQQRFNRFGLPLDRAALRAPQWPIEYGLGIMRFRLHRILTPFYALPTLVGHTGSTGTWLFHCPERDLFLAGTVDQATAGAVPFRFVPKMLQALDRSGRAL